MYFGDELGNLPEEGVVGEWNAKSALVRTRPGDQVVYWRAVAPLHVTPDEQRSLGVSEVLGGVVDSMIAEVQRASYALRDLP